MTKKKTHSIAKAARSGNESRIPAVSATAPKVVKSPAPGIRKGYSSRATIPAAILQALNQGTIESRTLAESLAIDFRVLMAGLLPQLAPDQLMALDPSVGVMQRMRNAGALLSRNATAALLTRLRRHPSDTVRCWVAFSLALRPKTTAENLLQRLRPLADDAHFGVRECAWMAFRPFVAVDVPRALALLQPDVTADSANLRRFATEVTRPRGVWCAHLEVLKESPELGLPLLEPVRADESRYVQNSVGNWLNDAARTRPEWVHALCRRWKKESPVPATQRICMRGLRSL